MSMNCIAAKRIFKFITSVCVVEEECESAAILFYKKHIFNNFFSLQLNLQNYDRDHLMKSTLFIFKKHSCFCEISLLIIVK